MTPFSPTKAAKNSTKPIPPRIPLMYSLLPNSTITSVTKRAVLISATASDAIGLPMNLAFFLAEQLPESSEYQR